MTTRRTIKDPSARRLGTMNKRSADPSAKRLGTYQIPKAKPKAKPKLVPVMRTIRGPKQGGYPQAGPGEAVMVNKYGYNPSVRTPVGREYKPRRGGSPATTRPRATNGTGYEHRWGDVQPPTYPQRFRLEPRPTTTRYTSERKPKKRKAGENKN